MYKALRRGRTPHRVLARPDIERFTQPIYDRQTIATSATTRLNFFQDPGGKTELQTNVTVAGQLPAPKIFGITGQGLAFDGNTVLLTDDVDLKLILWDGFYRLFIGSKDYLVLPIFMLPTNYGIDGYAATTTGTTDHKANWHAGPMFSNRRAVLTISPQQEFHTELNFPAAPTLTTARDVWSILYGEFGREVQ